MASENGMRTVNVEIRKSFQRIREEFMMNHVMAIIAETKTDKWTLELVGGTKDSPEWYKQNGQLPTEISIFFHLIGPEGPDADKEQQSRLMALADAADGNTITKRNWTLHRVNGTKWEPPTFQQQLKERERQLPEGAIPYAEVSMPIPADIKAVFSGVFGVDDQVTRITNQMRKSIKWEFERRSHGLLIGAPGCGKSETLKRARKLFPKPGAVLVIDGTAMTSAGLMDLLKKMAEEAGMLPRFIFVEEIDKAPNDAVSILLGLMDQRAELNKTTYRDKIQMECKVCVYATANSLEKVANFQGGALLSRFGNPITYDRPTDNVLALILEREMDTLRIEPCAKPCSKQVDGKTVQIPCGKCVACKNRKRWIKITIDWCHEKYEQFAVDTLDPRFVMETCLNGLEELEGNEYLRVLEATSVKKETIAQWG